MSSQPVGPKRFLKHAVSRVRKRWYSGNSPAGDQGLAISASERDHPLSTEAVAAAGFRLDATLTETGSDEPFASVLRRLADARPDQRAGSCEGSRSSHALPQLPDARVAAASRCPPNWAIPSITSGHQTRTLVL